jgi:Cof subfamily protein (haloacid dehalogenase superfamily)
MVERPDSHLVVLDIDGTLLTSSGSILPTTRSAIRELVARGHHVALASARPPRSVASLSQELLCERKTALVSLNGALVSRGDDIVHEQCIAPQTAAAIIRAARERRLTVSRFAGWQWHADEITKELLEEARIVGFAPTLVPDLRARTDTAHKLLAIGETTAIRQFSNWLNASALAVHATLSCPGYGEITAATASKAKAVAILRARLAIDRQSVIAFGDGENDISMLRDAGIGVAMGNASDVVKKAADRVTASNDHDGIASALGTLGLIG